MSSAFGWSLPPGCSLLPGEEPEPVQPRCLVCGAFLPSKPDRTESWEDWGLCDPFTFSDTPENRERGLVRDGPGGSEFLLAAGVVEITVCRRCGQEDRNSSM